MITEKIIYIGVDDHHIDLFEGQYFVPDGIAYNSYLIVDEKIAVMDSVDGRFADEWLGNIKNTLGNKSPDYLVVQHMEPDHSSSITHFVKAFPDAKIVSSSKAFTMMNNFFGDSFKDKQIVVGEGDTLSLGEHTLSFITAPMVHWPEVIMSYESKEKVLFSADAFGKFGTLDTDEEWACEARRYYFGIVGKYGAQVQNVLKKAKNLDIKIICPLHGPVLNENLDYYLNLYDIWSGYKSETEGVSINFASIYGNTAKAALKLAEMLEKRGVKVAVNDLARDDMAEAVEDAFRYDRVVFAASTYNNEVFPFMREFINHLTERNFQNKKVAFIENGSWAPNAAKVMKKLLENSKNLEYIDADVTILSALNETSLAQLESLSVELAK